MDYSMPGFPVLQCLSEFAKLTSIESMRPPNHLMLCCLLLFLLSIFPSIRVFSNESALHIRWPKYFSFSLSISSFMNIQGWFPVDWLVWSPCCLTDSQQSLAPQFESISSLVLSLLYGLTLISVCDYWKNHSFVSKVMSLLFNTLSRFVIAFLPKIKHLNVISWLQSPSTVILEPKKIKSVLFPLFPHLFAMKWWYQIPLS